MNELKQIVLKEDTWVSSGYRGRGKPALVRNLRRGERVNYSRIEKRPCGPWVEVWHRIWVWVEADGKEFDNQRRTWGLERFDPASYFGPEGMERVGLGVWNGYPGAFADDGFGNLVKLSDDHAPLHIYSTIKRVDDDFGQPMYTLTKPY